VKPATVLVPVNGTQSSRRGAELAFAIVPPSKANVVVTYVMEESPSPALGDRMRSPARRQRDEMIALGEWHGFEVTMVVHRDEEPAARAILRTAASRGANQLVIGAERRAGSALALGKTVGALVREWRGELVILAE